MAEFVELPQDALPSSGDKEGTRTGTSGKKGESGLWYSNVLAGVLRGALEMVSF